MSTLADIFNNLKTAVIRTNTAKIDRSIDLSIDQISKYSSSIQRNDYIETIKNLVGKVSDKDSLASPFLKDVKEVRAEYFDRSGRIQRYYEYDQIARNIAHCNRALNTLTDCIISPDDISKKSILISLNESFEQLYKKEDIEQVTKDLENIKKSINLEKYIDKIVRITLKKGDYFIEIINSPKGEQAFTILSESNEIDINDQIVEQVDLKYIKLDKDKNILVEGKSVTKKIIIEKTFNSSGSRHGRTGPTASGSWRGNSFPGALTSVGIQKSGMSPDTLKTKTQSDYPSNANVDAQGNTIIGDYSEDDLVDDKLFNSPSSNNNFDDDNITKLSDIFITLHNPKYVIRLETERFKSCLGYLVFPKVDLLKATSTMSNFNMINTDIDSLCVQIIKQIKTKVSSNDNISFKNNELKNAVLNYLSSLENADDLKIRYVPPDMMSHFRINTDIYDPYGESIFDCVLFDCKVFMALKTAQTIKRLTSSTDKRIIKVETGLPHNAKNLVDMLKENMRKRKISFDKFGSIDTIPSLISTFEDIYIPTRDGKEFVSIDNLKWGGDPQEDIEPLKFIRDNIVANLQVPPAFVGLEENSTNRNLLTAESVQFARTIISYQKQFAEALHDLFIKIYNLISNDDNNNELLNHINVAFSPPKAAMNEHSMEYLENASRAISTLKELGISEEYLKKTYLSFLDWDTIEKYDIEEKIKKGLEGKGDEENPNDMGGMGGMGGSMY